MATHQTKPPPYQKTETVGGVYVVTDNPPDDTDKVAINTDEEPEIDPWALPELKVDFTPWAELSCAAKFKRAVFHYFLKVVLLLGFLYLFICSLGFLGDAFKLLGGKTAGQYFTDSELLQNPVTGLMLGILATVLFQSSSTTTSVVVAMVAEEVMTVRLAIPIVMGANIGTSVTNTIVSLGQITNKDDFRRAFAGATVHDMFNWLTVIVLLPLEAATGYLYELSHAVIVKAFGNEFEETKKNDYLKVITKPFTKLIIQLDKKIINAVALGDETALNKSIIKHCCDKKLNKTIGCQEPCRFMFEDISKGENAISDEAVGGILLVLSLAILCICLFAIVKLLHSLLKGQIAYVLRKFINADFPTKCCGYFTGYLAILIGAGMTFLVQSSSIFTSSLTPLVGMGVISIERMYPLTLGSNIGTTTTGIIAALAQDSKKIPNALQIALCHLFFNISGILLFYPLPMFRPAIPAAKFLGNVTAKYRWFALAYLVVLFFLLPFAGFGLSSASWIAFVAVFGPIALIIILVMFIKLLQNKCPTALPRSMRNWKWLPVWLRSLEPYDRIFMRITGNCYCCRKCGCCQGIAVTTDGEASSGGKKGDVEMGGKENSGYIADSPMNTHL